MLAVTLLRDLGLGHPVCLHGADVSSQTVTVRQRGTARYPPISAILRAGIRGTDSRRERMLWSTGISAARARQRFYRPNLLPESPVADPAHTRCEARSRAAVRYASVRLVQEPWSPRTGTDGEGGSGMLTVPTGFFLPLQDACSLASSPSSPGSDSGRVSWTPRASVIRLFAASACASMQCA